MELPQKLFKIPYKPCRLLIIPGPFSAKGPQKYQKSIRFSLKVDYVLRFCKTPKNLSKTTFWSWQESCSKYLIKPVVYWSFWGPLRKRALKSIKKVLGFPLKVDYVLRFCKTPKTFSKTTFWSWQKSCSKYIIEHIVRWPFWGPFRKRALKSIKKH